MTVKSITGGTYRLGRRWKDGSRPFHGREQCQGDAKLTENVNKPHPCPWHAPSKHGMRTWPRIIRFDKYGMVERQCSHGVGHPDPDSVAFIREFIVAGDPGDYLSIHGCCGCCGGSP